MSEMRRILIYITVTAAALCVAASSHAQAPPKVFVDPGACPFKCCTYRQWTVRSNTVLYDRPEGTPVSEVRKGERVVAIDGEVHVVPTPMTVVFKHEGFRVGDRVFLLTYLGEGWMKVWFKGKISTHELPFIQSWRPQRSDVWPTCGQPSAECWGRIEKRESFDWWILIRTANGERGWTKQYDHFDGQDACG